MLYGPFPHLCEQKHQLDASSDEIQSFGGNSPVHLSPSLGAGSAVRKKGDKKNRRAKQTERESGERKGRRSFSLPSPPLDFPFFCCFTPFFAFASPHHYWAWSQTNSSLDLVSVNVLTGAERREGLFNIYLNSQSASLSA